jgi:hypothetical protein
MVLFEFVWIEEYLYFDFGGFKLYDYFNLLLAAGGMQDMQQMSMMPQNPLQQPGEVEKFFKNEKELLDLTAHSWKLENADIQLLQKYHRLPDDIDSEKKNA